MEVRRYVHFRVAVVVEGEEELLCGGVVHRVGGQEAAGTIAAARLAAAWWRRRPRAALARVAHRGSRARGQVQHPCHRLRDRAHQTLAEPCHHALKPSIDRHLSLSFIPGAVGTYLLQTIAGDATFKKIKTSHEGNTARKLTDT